MSSAWTAMPRRTWLRPAHRALESARTRHDQPTQDHAARSNRPRHHTIRAQEDELNLAGITSISILPAQKASRITGGASRNAPPHCSSVDPRSVRIAAPLMASRWNRPERVATPDALARHLRVPADGLDERPRRPTQTTSDSRRLRMWESSRIVARRFVRRWPPGIESDGLVRPGRAGPDRHQWFKIVALPKH